MAKTAITPTRAENFSEWYQNVISAADLAENSPVRGCMTIKPYGFAIWELLRDDMDRRIKSAGVTNAYFPLLIPLDYMTREAEHVDGFAQECAVVTHYRLKNVDGKIIPDPDAKLTEPYIIRPTSETIIGEAMSRWIQSYRDLPLKLNQWANVMRWEMRPRVFLRTSEFLWQEGHNVFATQADAHEDARKMHRVYNEFCREILAIPSIMGKKTPDERFAGADHTYTIEQMMQDGKALQGGTSHDLGQHFSKSFNIRFLGAAGQLEHAWTTSWGVSTRLMGSLIMSHSDDDGLVLPPNVAPHQIVIIPIIRDESKTDAIIQYATKLGNDLQKSGVRVLVDKSEMRSADKMWHWIKRGVPVRIEVGEREMDANVATFTRRDLGKPSLATKNYADVVSEMPELLKTIQSDLLATAEQRIQNMMHHVSTLDELQSGLASQKAGFYRMPYSETLKPEFDELISTYKISRRCLDDRDPTFVFVAKSY